MIVCQTLKKDLQSKKVVRVYHRWHREWRQLTWRMAVLPLLLPLVKPLALLIGPAPLFYLYRTWQSTPQHLQPLRRPLPSSSRLAISLLVLAALVYALFILFGNSENIFYLTNARFVTSPSVLQNRLSRLRPLTQDDTTLLERLSTSLSERLYYTTFGPIPLIQCTWCQTIHNEPSGPISLGDGKLYLLYSLPLIVTPYLSHAFVVGLLTTPFIASTSSTQNMRIYISYALGLLLSAELWILATFDSTVNSSAHDLKQVTWLHWELHTFRYTTLLLLSLLHAGFIYVSETGLIPLPLATEEKMFQIGMFADIVSQRINLARRIRGVVMLKDGWRDTVVRGWKLRGGIPEQNEIPAELRSKWKGEARAWVDNILKIEEEHVR